MYNINQYTSTSKIIDAEVIGLFIKDYYRLNLKLNHFINH